MAVTSFQLSDAVSRGSINQRIVEFNSFFPLSIENGGTGATTAEQARKNLGLMKPEYITFTGEDTMQLSKSVRNYSYITILYHTPYKLKPWCTSLFSIDVISSTSAQALSLDTEWQFYSSNYLICGNALMYVSSSGYTITLQRNGGAIIDRNTGKMYPAPYQPSSAPAPINPRIVIYSIVGYK